MACHEPVTCSWGGAAFSPTTGHTGIELTFLMARTPSRRLKACTKQFRSLRVPPNIIVSGSGGRVKMWYLLLRLESDSRAAEKATHTISSRLITSSGPASAMYLCTLQKGGHTQ